MPRGLKKKSKKAAKNRKTNTQTKQVVNNGQPPKTYFTQESTRQPPTEVNSIPKFEPFLQRGKVLPDNYQTVYSRYKAASKRVFEYLQEKIPRENTALPEDEQPIIHVSSLVAAADWIAEAQIPVDPNVLEDLEFAIRVRCKVVLSLHDGGDSAHGHLLDALVYCWHVLEPLPRAKTNVTDKTEKGEEELSKNRFEDLQESGELVSDLDAFIKKEIFSSRGDAPRPDFDDELIPLQEVLDSDDRVDACFFLLTLNQFMRCVSEKHANVVKVADFISEQNAHESAIVPAVMGATIATNMTIQQVQRLEIEFQLQNPHINTPYRLLAIVLCLPEQVKEVLQVSREHGNKLCSTRDVTQFLGDCFECSFRDKDDPENKASTIVSDFCSRFQIDSIGSKVIDETFFSLRCNTIAELPLKHEFKAAEASGRTSHAWLNHERFTQIAGDRSIHHTLRLLQWFGTAANSTPKSHFVEVPEGFFGSSPWQPGSSNKIHNDLDELLMTEILPNWFWICRDWVLSDGTIPPRQSELAPLWSCIRRFTRSPEKPVRWSTLFAVHAMLTAILETDKYSTELASACQDTFDTYFQQLDFACEHKNGLDGSFDSSFFQPGMTALRSLKQIGHHAFGQGALWNPLCAGTSLLFLNYLGNLECGVPLVDDRSQLKIVMHLYNALVSNYILKQGDIPFLDWLYFGTGKSETLWAGSLPPTKGKFVDQFWRSMGVSEKIIAKLSFLDGASPNQEHLEMIEMLCTNDPLATSDIMNPAEFSKSFRRICNRDYHDVVESCHSNEVRQDGSGNVHEFAARLDYTIEAYVKEHPLFTFNLPACGVYLDEFVSGMSRFFQWDQQYKGALNVENVQLEHQERMTEVYMFAHNVLGPLDRAKDPSELGEIKDFVTFFMCSFFGKLYSEGSCIWFQSMGPEFPEDAA